MTRLSLPVDKRRCSPSTRQWRSRPNSSNSTRAEKWRLCSAMAPRSCAMPASNGELLAKGKTVTGFANVEEDFADNAVWSADLLSRDKHVMPWRIEDELKKLGANYIQSGLWRSFAVRDGNLVTGQQNFSGAETARVIIEALGE